VGPSPPKPRGDWTGYQQTSISKTALPNHVRWDIDVLDAQQWLLRLTFVGNCVEQLYSVQPLPSCTAVSIEISKWIFLWLQMLGIPLNNGEFYKTHVAYRLVLIHSTCSSNRQSELKVTNANAPSAQSRFKNVILRHDYVKQKNSSCIETEQRSLCRIFHFNRQNLMLISLPND